MKHEAEQLEAAQLGLGSNPAQCESWVGNDRLGVVVADLLHLLRQIDDPGKMTISRMALGGRLCALPELERCSVSMPACERWEHTALMHSRAQRL